MTGLSAAADPRWTVEKPVSGIIPGDDGSAIVTVGSTMNYLDDNGTIVWTDKPEDSVSITADGHYVAAGGPYAVLFDRNGKKIWERENTGDSPDASDPLRVRISRNGNLILTSTASSFHTWGISGVMIGGNTSRSITRFGEGFTDATVSPSGDEIILFTTRGIYAVNRSGYLFREDDDKTDEEDWKCSTGILSPDGKTVLCASENSLYYGYPSGTLLWNKRIAGDEITGIAMSGGTDPIIVAGSLDGKVYLLDTGGNVLWDSKLFSYRTGQPITVSVSRSGAYLTARTLDTKTMQGAVFLFDRKGSPVWSIEGSDAVGILVPDGSALLIGTSSGLSSYAVADLVTAPAATVTTIIPVTTARDSQVTTVTTPRVSQTAPSTPVSQVTVKETPVATTLPVTTQKSPVSAVLTLLALAGIEALSAGRR